jgi:hypothetical protein
MVSVRISIKWLWQKKMADNPVVPNFTSGSDEEEWYEEEEVVDQSIDVQSALHSACNFTSQCNDVEIYRN